MQILNMKITYTGASLSREGFEELTDKLADSFNACKAEQGSGFLLSKGDWKSKVLFKKNYTHIQYILIY